MEENYNKTAEPKKEQIYLAKINSINRTIDEILKKTTFIRNEKPRDNEKDCEPPETELMRELVIVEGRLISLRDDIVV